MDSEEFDAVLEEDKFRAPSMCPNELNLISEMYIQYCDVYHNRLTNSSKFADVLTKKKLLELIQFTLKDKGHPYRSCEQIDQRIRDSVKRAKHFVDEKKKHAMSTGGGSPSDKSAPSHVLAIVKGLPDRPRLEGLKVNLETGSSTMEVKPNSYMKSKVKEEKNARREISTNEDNKENIKMSVHDADAVIPAVLAIKRKAKDNYCSDNQIKRRLYDKEYEVACLKLENEKLRNHILRMKRSKIAGEINEDHDYFAKFDEL